MTCPEDQCPLVARGVVGAPKFCKEVQDKFLANEEENAYVQLEVMGDPPPKPQWFMGDKPLQENERLKCWTDGKKGLVLLGIENCKKEDEGIYRCIITNRFGKREHKFKLFISGANGIAGWIVRRKDPPKREVPLYWTDTPRTKCIKLGANSVSFTAKLTVNNKQAVWFFDEQELAGLSAEKYDFIQENGSFTIKIKNPTLEDTGHYKCQLVDADGMSCQTYLDVQIPDPEHRITHGLQSQLSGFSLRPIQLSCLTSLGANVKWLKNQEQILDDRIVISEEEGEHRLWISRAAKSDSGTYTCKIIKYGVEGEDQTSCKVSITDFPHKFVQKLLELNGEEKSNLELEVTMGEEDAVVTWYKDGNKVTLERKRNQRLQFISKCKVRLLTINNCTVKDSGVYTAKTNADETSCRVNIAEFPHLFASGLQDSASVIEENKASFEVTTQQEDAEVNWFHDNIQFVQERSRIARVQMGSAGNKRTLIIKKCTPQDTARIEARTNKDISACNFMVKCYNAFEKRLVDLSECSERNQMEFDVCVRDITAPVTFYIDKVPVDTEDGRMEVINNGDGEHILVINKVLISDAGLITCRTPSNRGDEMLECRGIFNVIQGESEPLIEAVEPVSCVAILHSYRERTNAYIHKEQCRIVIPYQIEGERQSTMEIFVEKDGKEIEIGNEIRMKVTKDKVMIDVINPQREMSGVYKVTMKNAMGAAEVSVPVEVMDHPSSPLDVSVTDIFKDHVTVNWKPPVDDGGSKIKRYVIDVLDFTTNNMWTPVTMSETGQDTSAPVYNLVPGHRYCFRVSCANKVGVSDPTDMKATDVLTKDPWDVPSSCGKADVIDWTPSFADITWNPPSSDGGAEITSYIIEYKETNMRNWLEGVEIKVEEVDIWEDGLRGRCENLEEEYEYRFRVIAVNKGGKSEPGPPTWPIIAMHKNIPPYIKSGGLSDITIKEGRAIRFDVWFGGEPAPTAEWNRDGESLINDEGIVAIDVYSKNSVYTLKNAVFSIPNALEERDTGIYKLRLKNDCGVFESVANIKVEGPPGRKKLLQPKPKEEEKEVILEEDKPELIINRKLSDIKHDGKDDDKDSGLKIGEESCNDTEEEYEWTEHSYEDEDFYEGEGSDEQSLDNNTTNYHTNEQIEQTSSCQIIVENESPDENHIEEGCNSINIQSQNNVQHQSEHENHSPTTDYNKDNEKSIKDSTLYENNMKNSDSIYSNNIQPQQVETETQENVTESNISQKSLVNNNYEVDHETTNPYTCTNGYTNGWSSESDMNSTYEMPTSHENETSQKEVFSNDCNEVEEPIPYFTQYNDDNKMAEMSIKDGTDQNSLNSQSKTQSTSIKDQNIVNSFSSNEVEMASTTSDEVLTNSCKPNETESSISFSKEDSTNYLYPDDTVSYDTNNTNNDSSINQNNEKLTNGWLSNTMNESPTDTIKLSAEKEKAEKEQTIAKEKEAYNLRIKEKEEERKAKEEAERKSKEKERTKRENGLKMKINDLGFQQSETVDISLMRSGDGCLLALLDQMKQENQDFKVWDREDFSFLRWYICKQMESYIGKGLNIKFIQDMDIDPMTYVERVENDGEHLDNIFLQAAASIFNKDIVIISNDKDDDYTLLNGGIEGTRGKGSPLYLSHLEDSETSKNIYSSIVPNPEKYSKIINELDETIVQPTPKPTIVVDDIDLDDSQKHSIPEEVGNKLSIEGTDQSLNRVGSKTWKRMDSYNGGNTRELDQIIDAIKSEGGLEELQQSLDKCESDHEEDDECFDMLVNFCSESKKSNKYENMSTEQLREVPEYKEDIKEMVTNEHENSINLHNEMLKTGSNCSVNKSIVDSPDDDGKEEEIVNSSQNEDDWEYEDGWEYEDEEEQETLDIDTTNNVLNNEEQQKETIPLEEFSAVSADHGTLSQNRDNSVQENNKDGWEYEDEKELEALDINTTNNVLNIEEEQKETIPQEQFSAISADDSTLSQNRDNSVQENNEDEWEYEDEEDQNALDINTTNNVLNIEEQKKETIPHEQICAVSADHSDEEFCNNTPLKDIEKSYCYSEEENNFIPEGKSSESNHAKKTAKKIKIKISVSNENCDKPLEKSYRKESEGEFCNIGNIQHPNNADELLEISNKNKININENYSSKTCHEAITLDHVKEKEKEALNIILGVCDNFKNENDTCEEVDNCSTKNKSQNVVYELAKSKSQNQNNSLNKSQSQCEISRNDSNSKINQLNKSNSNNKMNHLEKSNSQNKLNRKNKINSQSTGTINNIEIQNNKSISQEKLDQTKHPMKELDLNLPFGSNNQPEVKMRKTLKYGKRKNSASFRWSGAEMFQVEGPDASIDPASEQANSIDIISKLNPEQVSLKDAGNSLDEKLNKIGFMSSPTQTKKETDSSNCLRALLDQMTRPDQDFKVWDRDDHSFLRWYIVKQMEIHISTGRSTSYMKNLTESPNDYVSRILKDEEYVDNTFLHAVAKVFNKDIIVVPYGGGSKDIIHIKGGRNDTAGKGRPLCLGYMDKENFSSDIYQSIVPKSEEDMSLLLKNQ